VARRRCVPSPLAARLSSFVRIPGCETSSSRGRTRSALPRDSFRSLKTALAVYLSGRAAAASKMRASPHESVIASGHRNDIIVVDAGELCLLAVHEAIGTPARVAGVVIVAYERLPSYVSASIQRSVPHNPGPPAHAGSPWEPQLLSVASTWGRISLRSSASQAVTHVACHLSRARARVTRARVRGEWPAGRVRERLDRRSHPRAVAT